jgi:hypothetical protein
MRVGSLKMIRVVSMVFMAVGCANAAFAQTFTAYGGEATALSGTVAGIPVSLAGTGAIDPSGGARNNSLVCYPGGPQCYAGVPDATSGLLSAQTLSAAVVGQGDQTYAHSSLANLSLVVQGLLIRADYSESQVKSICKDDGGGGRVCESRGNSEFNKLTIAGAPVVVTGLPNQLVTVPSPLGTTVTIMINEQTVSNGYLTVRALRIKGPYVPGVVNATDVSVAVGKTKTDCGNIDKCLDPKVTGGGFVIFGVARITFAVSGRNADTWGHLVAVNHTTGRKFKATTQTTQLFADGSAKIEGFGEIDGDGGAHPFVARVKDSGEPGTGVDEFSLDVLDEVGSFDIPPGTRIAGGNIQFHGPKAGCPPLPPPPVECPPGMVPDPNNEGGCRFPPE